MFTWRTGKERESSQSIVVTKDIHNVNWEGRSTGLSCTELALWWLVYLTSQVSHREWIYQYLVDAKQFDVIDVAWDGNDGSTYQLLHFEPRALYTKPYLAVNYWPSTQQSLLSQLYSTQHSMSPSTHYCTTQFNVIDGAKDLSVSPFTSSHSVQNLTWQSWLTSNTTLFSLPTLLNTTSSSTLYFASQIRRIHHSFVAGAGLFPISQRVLDMH